MKAALVLTSIFVSVMASASGTSIGNGIVACPEGQVETFASPAGDGTTVYETYVCRNGRLVGSKPYVSQTPRDQRCLEGERVSWFEGPVDSMSEGRTSTYLCRNGRFIRQN